MPGPDGQGPSPTGGEEPAQEDEPKLACCNPLVVPPELGGPEEVWNGLGGDVVAQAHPNGPRGEDDIAIAGVPSCERVRVFATEALTNPLHGDALRNGLGGEVRLAAEELLAVLRDGAPVNLERSLHAEERLPGAVLGDHQSGSSVLTEVSVKMESAA